MLRVYESDKFDKKYISGYPQSIPGYLKNQAIIIQQLAVKFGWDDNTTVSKLTGFLGKAWEQLVLEINQNIPSFEDFLKYVTKVYGDKKLKESDVSELKKAVKYFYLQKIN